MRKLNKTQLKAVKTLLKRITTFKFFGKSIIKFFTEKGIPRPNFIKIGDKNLIFSVILEESCDDLVDAFIGTTDDEIFRAVAKKISKSIEKNKFVNVLHDMVYNESKKIKAGGFIYKILDYPNIYVFQADYKNFDSFSCVFTIKGNNILFINVIPKGYSEPISTLLDNYYLASILYPRYTYKISNDEYMRMRKFL